MLNGVLDNAYYEVVVAYVEHVQVLFLPEKAERGYITLQYWQSHGFAARWVWVSSVAWKRTRKSLLSQHYFNIKK